MHYCLGFSFLFFKLIHFHNHSLNAFSFLTYTTCVCYYCYYYCEFDDYCSYVFQIIAIIIIFGAYNFVKEYENYIIVHAKYFNWIYITAATHSEFSLKNFHFF